MIFSSPTFLFLFLPLVLTAWLLAGRSKTVLLVASLIYYAWDQPIFLVLLGVVIVSNYLLGEVIGAKSGRPRRTYFVAGLVLNLLILAIFKYSAFLVSNWNGLALFAGLPAVAIPAIPAPLGISFFTFQALAYLIDIYKREIAPAHSLSRYALFKAFFPQLIAGPIVRYQWVAEDFQSDLANEEMFAHGVERFIVGLAKKVILADPLAGIADAVFGLQPHALTMEAAWVGAICFGLQIYFDFSGYSDMAIGLGRMFGIRLPENFRYPYEATSIQDFWRRWHITLSTWFRDYLYIPLGGSRRGTLVTFRNLLIVFALCGLWHGPTWVFVIWGLYHGVFLILERTPFNELLRRSPLFVQHAYTLMVVLFGWVIFRSPTLNYALEMIGRMFSLPGNGLPVAVPIDPLTWSIIVLAALSSVPTPLYRKVAQWSGAAAAYEAALSALLVISLAFVATQTHLAFIYFRF